MPLAYAATATVLVVVVVAMAYGSVAPSLGVAEFAPAARQQVDAPPTTGAPEAKAGGATGGRRATTTTAAAAADSTAPSASATAAPTTRVLRGRPCYGTPPRQTEDPMSPACIAEIFEGDNGGATSTGVSATEIRVAIPGLAPTSSAATRQAIEALFEHMNRSFELYGRRLVPVYVSGTSADAISSRALGSTVASQGVFAALTGYRESYETNTLKAMQPGIVHELARSGVVTVVRNAGLGWSDRQVFDLLHPYVWSVYPSMEANLAHMGNFACTALVGRPAAHARDVGLREKSRKFAVVVMGQQVLPSAREVVDELSGCGASPSIFQWTGYSSTSSADVRAGLEKLRSEGVTTVVCVCESLHAYWTAVPAANQLGFGPEWVVLPSSLFTDEDVQQRAAHTAAFIRLESGPRLLPLQERPWFKAVLAENSKMLATTNDVRSAFEPASMTYESLLLLAAGIQGAGPQLTPHTFAAGLMSAQFPNPGAGQPPFWQPSAGFGPGDHSFYDDYALAWWSQEASSVDPNSTLQGSWCYLGAGERYRIGSFPADADARLYNPAEPCR